MDSSNHCCILQYSSHKARRATRSSLAEETFALSNTFDHSYLLKHDLQQILGMHEPILMLTDSNLLFDVITGNRYTTEARLVVDIAAVCEAYNQRIISNIALTDLAYNIADPLIKIVYSPPLKKVMTTSYLNHTIRKYVLDTNLELSG